MVNSSLRFRHHRNCDNPDEKKDETKQLIRSKINEYLTRADTVGNGPNSVSDYLWNIILLGFIFQAFPELVNTL